MYTSSLGKKMPNSVALASTAITVIITAIYLALIIPILVLHETVPDAPSNPANYRGTNITEAWLDLTVLSKEYHPYNSKYNDDVRNWLLLRIGNILDKNGVNWVTELGQGISADAKNGILPTGNHTADSAVTVFDDLVSNVTCSALGSLGAPGSARKPGQSVYFEGTNIMVYIRGTEDEDGPWWNSVSCIC